MSACQVTKRHGFAGPRNPCPCNSISAGQDTKDDHSAGTGKRKNGLMTEPISRNHTQNHVSQTRHVQCFAYHIPVGCLVNHEYAMREMDEPNASRIENWHVAALARNNTLRSRGGEVVSSASVIRHLRRPCSTCLSAHQPVPSTSSLRL